MKCLDLCSPFLLMQSIVRLIGYKPLNIKKQLNTDLGLIIEEFYYMYLRQISWVLPLGTNELRSCALFKVHINLSSTL